MRGVLGPGVWESTPLSRNIPHSLKASSNFQSQADFSKQLDSISPPLKHSVFSLGDGGQEQSEQKPWSQVLECVWIWVAPKGKNYCTVQRWKIPLWQCHSSGRVEFGEEKAVVEDVSGCCPKPMGEAGSRLVRVGWGCSNPSKMCLELSVLRLNALEMNRFLKPESGNFTNVFCVFVCCFFFFPSWLELIPSSTIWGRERHTKLLVLTFENSLVWGFWPRYKHQIMSRWIELNC